MSQPVSSKSGTLDINKYITGFPSVVGDGSQEDINLIEIYFINRDIRGQQENIMDVSVKNSLETFIDNYYKKSRVENYKSYTHK